MTRVRDDATMFVRHSTMPVVSPPTSSDCNLEGPTHASRGLSLSGTSLLVGPSSYGGLIDDDLIAIRPLHA